MEKAENSNFFLRNNVLYKTCPSCTKGVGKEIFYPCPQSFGFRYEGKYIQSCCNRCRGLKGTPSTPFENYTLRHAEDKIIPEIRALPLGKNEFENIEDCIHFLTKEMPPRGNTFYYRAHNMVTVPGSLILFQYDGKIIAYGFFENEKKLSEEPDKLYLEQGYTGYYKFKEDSIQILSTPITNKEMQDNFNVSLGQGTTKISVNYLPKLMEFFNIKSEYVEIIEKESIDIQEKTLSLVDKFEIIGKHEHIKLNTTAKEKDYIKAYKNQASVGASGEELIRDYEISRLTNLGKLELAKKVDIVSSDATLGYDVLSFEENGQEKHIEVKTKSSKLNYMDFYISDNEYEKLKTSENHYIYYVSNLKSKTPQLFILSKETLDEKYLKPVLYRVSLDYIIDNK